VQQAAAAPTLVPMIAASKAFSAADCDSICQIGMQMEHRKGEFTAPEQNAEARRSTIALIPQSSAVQWIYDRIFGVVAQFNRQYWQFDLAGSERLQFGRYGVGEHYDWHMDLGSRGTFTLRKLSVSVQLSDPESYEGGDLEINMGSFSKMASREKGALIIFPSYALHKVHPVTQGERRSLVAWIVGNGPLR
jgi:PKHD-type hydroxylase